MILHENRLPAEDAHEISCLICYFLKKRQIFFCRLLQIIGGALRVKLQKRLQFFFFTSFFIAGETRLDISNESSASYEMSTLFSF